MQTRPCSICLLLPFLSLLACSEDPNPRTPAPDGAPPHSEGGPAGDGEPKPPTDASTADGGLGDTSLPPPPGFDPRAAPLLTAGSQGSAKAIDKAQWQASSMRHDVAPVDLSFLNHKPAGSRGFVERVGDALRFADGTPARFWGANVAAYAIFRPKEEIDAQAKRLARLGYNLVRIHHHDSTSWVSPTVIDKSKNDSRQLDAEGMDAVDYWIKALAAEGIYVFLDLHVGRQLKAGDKTTEHGTVVTFDEVQKGGGEVKGFAQYDPAIQKLMVEFQQKYLGHENPYRKLAYKDDPAVMGLLITNENDLTHHFGNRALPDKNNPVLNGLFNKAREDFAAASGLSFDKMFTTWEPGEAKIFLNNQEHLFNEVLLDSLGDLGVKVPVATTNMWGLPSFSLPAITDGSLLDVHAYQGPGFLAADPRSKANNAHWIVGAQVAGFPVSITEWNMTADSGQPTADRYAAPLFMAAIGALQGWDAPMLYNYSQTAFKAPTKVPGWTTFADPGMQAPTPAAALAFRQGQIQPASKSYCLAYSRDSLYFKEVSAATSATIRTLAEQSQLAACLPEIPELTWDKATTAPAGATTISELDKDFLPGDATHVESDTGELRRYWAQEVQTINTAYVQAAQGKIGGWEIALGNVTIKVTTPEAAVIVSALDSKPLASSDKILITTVGRVESRGGTPYVAEPVVGELVLEAKAGKTLVPLAPDGSEGKAIGTSHAGGRYTIPLAQGTFSHWYLLR